MDTIGIKIYRAFGIGLLGIFLFSCDASRAPATKSPSIQIPDFELERSVSLLNNTSYPIKFKYRTNNTEWSNYRIDPLERKLINIIPNNELQIVVPRKGQNSIQMTLSRNASYQLYFSNSSKSIELSLID